MDLSQALAGRWRGFAMDARRLEVFMQPRHAYDSAANSRKMFLARALVWIVQWYCGAEVGCNAVK